MTKGTLDRLMASELDDLAERLDAASRTYRNGKGDGTEVERALTACDDLARFAERLRAAEAGA